MTRDGGCHCGALRVAFATHLDLAGLVPRACDCSFCRKHGAAWLSDPEGRLAIAARGDALQTYRQGSEAADFLVCRQCGVLVAVVFEHDARRHGAVNAGCLDDCDALAPAVIVSPKALAPEEKAARWLALWIPDVTVASLAD